MGLSGLLINSEWPPLWRLSGVRSYLERFPGAALACPWLLSRIPSGCIGMRRFPLLARDSQTLHLLPHSNHRCLYTLFDGLPLFLKSLLTPLRPVLPCVS
jgi:hypothetical protein